MKITVTPDGGIVLDIPENTLSPNTVSLIRGLRNNKPVKEPLLDVERIPRETVKPEPRKRGARKLSRALAETRDLMVGLGTTVSAAEVGEGLGIKPATATWRLRKLEDKGFAQRVGRGQYRLVAKRGG